MREEYPHTTFKNVCELCSIIATYRYIYYFQPRAEYESSQVGIVLIKYNIDRDGSEFCFN